MCRGPLAVFGISNPEWNALVIAALTAVVVTFATTAIRERFRLWSESELYKRKADAEFEASARKKLRDTIGGYRGQLVEAATDFNYRLENLRNNAKEGWLDKGGDYWGPRGEDHYFRSTVYRFGVLMSVANRFEREAHHIDERYSEALDRTFLLYAKAFRWVMTDVALFKPLEGYDPSESTDHFFTDQLREMCAGLHEGTRTLRFDEFESRINEYEFQDVLEFFDALPSRPLAWDRVVALRLVVQAFINTFGYPHQKNRPDHMLEVARSIRHEKVVGNLAFWLEEKLGLEGDVETKALVNVLRTIVPERAPTAS